MRLPRLIAAVVLVLSATTLEAQDTVSTAARPASTMFGARKSVTTARLLAIVPSAGHFYAGEGRRGLTFLGGMAGVLLIGTLAVVGDCIADYDAPSEEACENDFRDTAITVAFYGIWGWSIYDAGLAARRTNARRSTGASLMIAPSRVSVAGRGASGLNVGITIPAR